MNQKTFEIIFINGKFSNNYIKNSTSKYISLGVSALGEDLDQHLLYCKLDNLLIIYNDYQWNRIRERNNMIADGGEMKYEMKRELIGEIIRNKHYYHIQ